MLSFSSRSRQLILRAAKRALDLILSSVALLVASPLFLVIALAIRFDDQGPVIFRQERIGREGRVFVCLKFRSMIQDAETQLEAWAQTNPERFAAYWVNVKLKDDPRVTRVGKLLRKTSLDELPQLFNVLRGDMSLVGPRPISPGERDRYGPALASYVQVRPGLTGLWQVSGRSDCSFEERVKLDVQYVRTESLRLYFWILWETVPAVLQRKGAY